MPFRVSIRSHPTSYAKIIISLLFSVFFLKEPMALFHVYIRSDPASYVKMITLLLLLFVIRTFSIAFARMGD